MNDTRDKTTSNVDALTEPSESTSNKVEETSDHSPSNNRSRALRRIPLFLFLAIAGTAADLISKQMIFASRGLPGQLPPWWLVEDYIGIETAVNMGALFGMGQGYSGVFAVLSIVAGIGIFIWLFVYGAAQSLWLTCAMGLVSGGIVGNLYDRLGIPNLPDPIRGGVRDWILLRYGQYTWPNFNIADSLLVAGAIMLGVHSLLLAPSDKRFTHSDTPERSN